MNDGVVGNFVPIETLGATIDGSARLRADYTHKTAAAGGVSL
jgi:hypothetical protein